MMNVENKIKSISKRLFLISIPIFFTWIIVVLVASLAEKVPSLVTFATAAATVAAAVATWMAAIKAAESAKRGNEIRWHFRSVSRTKKLRGEIEEHNGQEGYLLHIKQRDVNSVETFLKELEAYNVSSLQCESD